MGTVNDCLKDSKIICADFISPKHLRDWHHMFHPCRLKDWAVDNKVLQRFVFFSVAWTDYRLSSGDVAGVDWVPLDGNMGMYYSLLHSQQILRECGPYEVCSCGLSVCSVFMQLFHP